MTLIPASNQNDYPTLPDMEPISVTITEFTGPKTYTFDGVDKERYHAVMTPTDPKLSASHINAWYLRSWSVKTGNGSTGLRNLVSALHPKDLTEAQLLEFDPDILEFFVGRQVTVLGKTNDRGYFDVVAYKRSKETAPAAKTQAVEAPAEEVLAV